MKKIYYKKENNKIPKIIIDEIIKEKNETKSFIKISNFKDYIKKIEENARIIAIIDYANNEIVKVYGFCIYYSNDFTNLEAFITLLIVNKNYRKMGYGDELIKNVIDDVLNSGFKKLSLCVNKNNDKAIKLYHKKGFIYSKVINNDIRMVLNLDN